MAKAKKESSAKSEPRSAPAKKPAAKKAAPAATGSSGVFVDTNLAAASAARMLAARVATKSSSAVDQPHTESSMFKQLKGGLSKPAGQTMSNLLDKQGGPSDKKPAIPYGANSQVGRNQTFGADVNRAGVPRRTGGG